jgi:hypothetical protein
MVVLASVVFSKIACKEGYFITGWLPPDGNSEIESEVAEPKT